MPFKKAVHEESRLKLAIYGPPGSGKTFTALLIAEGLVAPTKKRIAILDTEKGTRYYDVERPDAVVHPAAFDFDRVHTRSLSDARREAEQIDPKTHGVLIVDSMSHFWDAAQDAVKERTRAGTIQLKDWGKVKKPYKEFVDILMQMPLDVMILGRQKNVFEEDASGDLKKVGVTMRAEPETPHEPDIVMVMRQAGVGKYEAFFEKDRTSVLSGKRIENPSFDTFKPILPLLGRTHVGSESDESRLEKDVDMILGEEQKQRQREELSAELFLLFQATFSSCKTQDALKAAADDLKKRRKELTDEHRAKLLELHEQVRNVLSRKQVPTP